MAKPKYRLSDSGFLEQEVSDWVGEIREILRRHSGSKLETILVDNPDGTRLIKMSVELPVSGKK